MSNLIRKSLLTVGLGLIMSGVVASSSAAGVSGTTAVSGHVPAILSKLSAKGRLSAETNLNLAIGLPLRNREALTNLLEQIYDPASTNYHHYLTPGQFTAQFGPTEQDYQTVSNFAKLNGLTVTGRHSNRTLLDVSGKVSDIEKALHVTLRTYRHPTEARDFFAPDVEPSVDANVPVLHIVGLDNYGSLRPALHQMPAANAKPAAGSAPGGGYMGKDFRNAYVPGTPLTGAGQNVGLFQLDGYFPADIAAYENQIGLTNNIPQLVTVPVDGGVPVPTSFGNPEVSLDIEMVLSMSPGVSKIYVYEGPNSGNVITVFDDVLNRMANDNLAKQLSCSWFIFNGPPDPAAEQIFQQMAVQGQTFFCASGDDDAYAGLIPFPSDSPHITLVGGTTLTTRFDSSYRSETVWNWDIEFGPAADGIGSGGGISTTYAIPTWQTNINMTASQGSNIRRNVPDVALTADNVFVIFGGGSQGDFGGTSCAAPLWAGFTALINQQAANNSHPPVGFLNPALYALAAGPGYTNCFHDITTDNNEWSGSPNLFSAVINYDLCTGLGTPNGTNLINALFATGNTVTHISAPLPPYGATLTALNGGNPNGTWTLFVQDDQALDAGIISNGWVLNLTTASPVGFAGDLALSMTVSPASIPLGSNVVFSIGVTNYGPSVSSNALVSDTLPLGVTLVSATTTQGSIDSGGFGLTWGVGTLATNAGAQLTLTVQPNAVGIFTDAAFVSAATPDPNADDDFASASVTVGSVAPPQLSGNLVGANGAFQFTVTGQSGQEYIIQASTNLVTGPWVPVFTNPPPFTSPFLFTDPNAANFRYRFYRAVTGP